MSKGIAIQTILLLVVGILVVGIVVYMVYRFTTGSTLSKYECQSRVVSWCTRMRMSVHWNSGCDCTDGTCLHTCPDQCPNCPWDQWVKFCVISESDRRWNFDPSATIHQYDGAASTYCPRVGVS